MHSKLVCGLTLAVGMAHGAHVLVRRDGAHGHSAAAPSSGYSTPNNPSSGYGTPQDTGSSYAAPASSYEQSAPAYDAPSSGYDTGASYDTGYSPSGYGAEEEPFPISALIIPILIIAGLSLLFPTITSVSVRKRRHAEHGKYSTHIAHLNNNDTNNSTH